MTRPDEDRVAPIIHLSVCDPRSTVIWSHCGLEDPGTTSKPEECNCKACLETHLDQAMGLLERLSRLGPDGVRIEQELFLVLHRLELATERVTGWPTWLGGLERTPTTGWTGDDQPDGKPLDIYRGGEGSLQSDLLLVFKREDVANRQTRERLIAEVKRHRQDYERRQDARWWELFGMALGDCGRLAALSEAEYNYVRDEWHRTLGTTSGPFEHAREVARDQANAGWTQDDTGWRRLHSHLGMAELVKAARRSIDADLARAGLDPAKVAAAAVAQLRGFDFTEPNPAPAVAAHVQREAGSGRMAISYTPAPETRTVTCPSKTCRSPVPDEGHTYLHCRECGSTFEWDRAGAELGADR